MKLHLGCYHKKIHGFVNIDIREDVNPDIVDDIFKLEKFKAGSVELIYASHVLEHLDHKDSKAALKRWYDVLQDEGVVRIAVPNMEMVFAHYFYHKDLPALYSALWGSQRHPYDYHKHGWTFDTLRQDLIDVGFDPYSVRLYNWRETEHSFVDDYSQAYVPHMDKEHGKLMSLNVEAIKHV
jgi:predicted SAM-dependent methyltransferase